MRMEGYRSVSGVVVVRHHAPWHSGTLVQAAFQACPYLDLYRLPSSSPQLQIIERLWKVLRRRAPHTRFFLTVAALKKALRHSLAYCQTLRHRALSLIQRPKKRTTSSAA